MRTLQMMIRVWIGMETTHSGDYAEQKRRYGECPAALLRLLCCCVLRATRAVAPRAAPPPPSTLSPKQPAAPGGPAPQRAARGHAAAACTRRIEAASHATVDLMQRQHTA